MLRKAQVSPHQKYSCIKPEDIECGKEYSFSFNPEDQPKFERFYNMKLNTLRTFSEENEKIFHLLRYCDVKVYLEISSKGRFHYHGYIKIEHIPKFIIHDLAKLRSVGTYEIDMIKSPETWWQYVSKQRHFMLDYAKQNDMKYEIDTFDKLVA